MIKLLDTTQPEEWDNIVKSFKDYDVYYLWGYVRAFEIHGDGKAQLFYYYDNNIRGIYVYFKRETHINGVFDSVTPYGYGGFLFDGEITNVNLKKVWSSYVHCMNNENIVDNFVRYHPILNNALFMKPISEIIDLGKTIAIDLTSEDIIWTNIHSKNRNMIRKAEKNGVQIKHGQGKELLAEFVKIYNSTMYKDNADKYYYFEPEFYDSINTDLKNNHEIFWAEYEGKIIAMSIMIYANYRLNYHLSGSYLEYKNLAPSNLLLYQAAIWGHRNGMKTFHLGGGVGSGEDNLFKFKKSFNRFSNFQFSIAKQIFNRETYDMLVLEWSKLNPDLNMKTNYFPAYRS